MRLTLRHLMTTTAVILCAGLVAACADGEERSVWFIHATDPHVFEPAAAPGPPTDPDDARRRRDEAARRAHQEQLNRRAFQRLLATMDDLPGTEAAPRFLLLTGDLGFGETGPLGEPSESLRDQRLDELVRLFSGAGELTVYYVPGNNDVPGERAEGLPAANDFIRDLADRLERRGVTLRDLTACYPEGRPASGCTAEIDDTPFRLIGFPTHSFKTKRPPAEVVPAPAAAPPATAPSQPSPAAAPDDAEPGEAGGTATPPVAGTTARSDGDALHLSWVEKLSELVAQARADEQRVLIATHIPEINDPFIQAQEDYASVRRYDPARPDRPRWSAWDVSPQVFTRWNEIIGSPTVAAVFAGHFHDSHEGIYRPEYPWERRPNGAPAPDRDKILVAPPLAAKLQDTSPVQARGFALIRLAGGEVSRQIFWYDPAHDRFREDRPDRGTDNGDGERGRSKTVATVWSWLWSLGEGAEPLDRAAVQLIAFLAAFLTVVAIWKIPPTDSRLRTDSQKERAQEEATAGATTGGPFDNNFTRAVIGGFTGMVGVALLEDDLLDYKTYYIVCFIVFFLAILFLYALIRGLVEGIRSRLAAGHEPFREGSLGRRFWRWLLSLRSFVLTFFDASFNVIQGENQLETAVLGETIVDLQKSLVGTVDQIAEELHRTLFSVLVGLAATAGIPRPERKDIRVNVSVLSDDRSQLTYVSLTKGSLLKPFGKMSIAGVVATSAEARWWKQDYMKKDISVLDNRDGHVKDFPQEEIPLAEAWEPRGPIDYAGFVVLPIPWYSRGGIRQGVLHVSFKDATHMNALWRGLEDANGLPPYDLWRQLVELCVSNPPPGSLCVVDAQLSAALRQALGVLPEVLRSFNPSLFEDLIKPR